MRDRVVMLQQFTQMVQATKWEIFYSITVSHWYQLTLYQLVGCCSIPTRSRTCYQLILQLQLASNRYQLTLCQLVGCCSVHMYQLDLRSGTNSYHTNLAYSITSSQSPAWYQHIFTAAYQLDFAPGTNSYHTNSRSSQPSAWYQFISYQLVGCCSVPTLVPTCIIPSQCFGWYQLIFITAYQFSFASGVNSYVYQLQRQVSLRLVPTHLVPTGWLLQRTNSISHLVPTRIRPSHCPAWCQLIFTATQSVSHLVPTHTIPTPAYRIKSTPFANWLVAAAYQLDLRHGTNSYHTNDQRLTNCVLFRFSFNKIKSPIFHFSFFLTFSFFSYL